MLLFRHRLIFKPRLVRNQGTLSTALEQQKISSIPSQENGELSEYTEKPEYPEILDMSYEARKARKKQLWYDEIKNIKTIEEKLLKINMPRYYGYKTVALKDDKFPYNCLPMTQHYTRTLFEETDKLPTGYYEKDIQNVDSFIQHFKSEIQNVIEFGTEFFRRQYSIADEKPEPAEADKMLGDILVKQINHVLLCSLMSDCHHLKEIDFDYDPRHEAFWFVGGVNPSNAAQRMRKGCEWTKKYVDDPYDRAIQYMGRPYLALRHRNPLPPVHSTNDPLNPDDLSKVPLYKYDPRVLGYIPEYRHGTTIPGYWPGSPHEFGLLSYQKRDHLVTRNQDFGIEDFKEAIHAQGIQSSFAWLYAQACYQGFSTFHDVTYPLCTQTIITNGQKFSFYLYQLNTTLIYSDNVYNNQKINYCWGTKEMKLYEEIDKNGKCIGFNDDVLKNLIHFYVKEPKLRNDIEMKPYLGKNEQKIADIENEDRREFLENTYKHMTSNRPRHLSLPEIYPWEKIYKIDNKTRVMEPKRRFFELRKNPFKRTMDDHTPKYIPKALRPDGPKSKKKWEKMYYP